MNTPTTYKELVAFVLDFINILIPTLFAMVFLYFVWKMIDSWILNAGDQNSREAGKRYALSAVIVFVVMIIAWGVVVIIKESLFG